jgi:hypothetical protein
MEFVSPSPFLRQPGTRDCTRQADEHLMSPERRNYTRRIVYSPEYLDMGADNGGVVVNLSEGGLAFQAVAPVERDAEIPVSFSLGQGYRIDVKARVVWVDAQGKAGGAAFGKLSKDSHSLIREWLSKAEFEHETEGAVAVETAVDTGPHLQSAPPLEPVVASPAAPPLQQTALQEPLRRPEPVVAARPSQDAAVSVSPPTDEPMRNETWAAAAPRQQEIPVAVPPVAVPPVAVPPEPIRRKPPVQDVPTSPRRNSEESFSVVPSISAWSRKDAPRKPIASASPLRNTENIFARPRSASPSFESETGGKGSRTLIVIALVIAAGAVVASYARAHRQQIGDSIVRIGNSVAGQPATSSAAAPNRASGNASQAPENSSSTSGNSAPPATTTAPTAPTASAQQPAVSAMQNASSKVPADNPAQAGGDSKAPPNSAPDTQRAQAGKGAAATSGQIGQTEYQRAEQYLNGKSGIAQDPAEAAEWFWRSLEAGNTDAAVPLAGLYLEGNGVSRSCVQAQILLQTAAEKGNSEAIKKLAQLPENCQ